MSYDQINYEQKKWIVLIVFAVILCVMIALILSMNERVRYQSDFFARWYATKALIEQKRNIYDPQNELEIVEYKFIPTMQEEVGFYYPGHLLLLIMPLAILPYEIAHCIWTTFIQLFLIFGLLLVTKELKWPSNVNKLTILLLLSILFIPMLQHTIWSQFDTIAILFFSLSYLALRQEKYIVAGILAIGLTFKPQGNLLLLIVLLFWSALNRKRWGFVVGFLLSSFLIFVSVDMIQPNWVGDFVEELTIYRELPYNIQSVLDSWWNPNQILAIILTIFTLALSVGLRNIEPAKPIFGLYIAFVFGVWWLVVPIIGMLHLVMMPIAFVFLISGLNQLDQDIYRYAIIIFSFIYLLGFSGFVFGLSNPSLYGLHIHLAEMGYKKLGVIMLIAFSLPFLLQFSWERLWDDRR